MKGRGSKYANIWAIIARKIAGRRQQATLSFAEKLAIMDEMKERVAPIIHARELRKSRRRQSVVEHI
jgi:hypothetical protein